MASESSVVPTMAFWEPGMPAKAFDPFNIDRVKADLADGSCTVFPVEDYKEYLIERVRETAISQGTRDFTVEPYERIRCGIVNYHAVDEYLAFGKGCGDSFHYDDIEKYVCGFSYIDYAPLENNMWGYRESDRLQMNIRIGSETGFDNPSIITAGYVITWIGNTVFDGNEDSDREW